jgi:hypothetical protein
LAQLVVAQRGLQFISNFHERHGPHYTSGESAALDINRGQGYI